MGNECLALRTRMAARAVTRRFDEALRPLKLRVTQFTLLVAIEKGEPAKIPDLAHRLAMERTTLIRNLKVMDRAGLVDAGPEGYQRSRSLRLTQKGRDLLARALPRWRQVQAQLEAEVGARDTPELRALLERLARSQP